MARLLLLKLFDDGRDGRCELSLDLGAESEVGEPAGDLLVEADGTERLPDRLGSLGDGGGPIVATLAIVASVGAGRADEEKMGMGGKQETQFRLKQLSG